ncbi:MAG: helix-hairpin-helix domain-containing protein [Anaerolineaceae bacterium]
MKLWQNILIGIFGGLLLGGVILLFILPQRGQPIQLVTIAPDLTPAPSPTVAPIQVHVAGAVKQPGLYSLQPGARVQDGINAANGTTENADLERLNLSAFLNDGERLYVPLQGQVVPTDEVTKGSQPVLEINGLVNINTATLEQLISLPGIGSTKASAIITYRADHGPFTQIDELLNVSGIGPVTLENIKPLITLGP